MIGILPETLEVNGKEYEINTDFHIALLIFEVMEDPNISDTEKAFVILSLLFCDFGNMPEEDYEEALKQTAWYLDGGRIQKPVSEKPVMSWTQDENLIFSGINKIIGGGTDARSLRMHWWTFLGYFDEIGEGPFQQVIAIRIKKNKGQKLEKYEKEYYRKNKEIIDIKRRLSDEEQDEMEALKKLLK